MQELGYSIESNKPFDSVVADIERLTPEYKFRVLAVHDVQATLAEKGFQREPLKIIEVCSASFAHEALDKEIGVAMFMPCRYTVYTKDSKTVITLARPGMIATMFPDAGLESMASEVEEILQRIMHEAG